LKKGPSKAKALILHNEEKVPWEEVRLVATRNRDQTKNIHGRGHRPSRKNYELRNSKQNTIAWGGRGSLLTPTETKMVGCVRREQKRKRFTWG